MAINLKYNKVRKFHKFAGRFIPAMELINIRLGNFKSETIFQRKFRPILDSICLKHVEDHLEKVLDIKFYDRLQI